MNLATPPPRSLHQEIQQAHRAKRGREVQTYFGCLACRRGRKCPPERGWPNGKRVPVRELMGLTSPWYFSAVPRTAVASAKYSKAWRQLHDPAGFGAKWGPRTTERRHSCYNFSNGAQCNWNGGSWPYETSKAGTALINLLQLYPEQTHGTRADFDRLLRDYARAHTRSHAENLPPPHVDEDLHPDDGYWITRRKLHGIHPWPGTGGLGNPRDRSPTGAGRGTHYFHSTFNDLVLAGLVGVRPATTHVELHPLSLVQWFAATGVLVRGHDLAVVWDASGTQYGSGSGLHVWLDGKYTGVAPPVRVGDEVRAPRVRVGWGGGKLVVCAQPVRPADTPGVAVAWSDC